MRLRPLVLLVVSATALFGVCSPSLSAQAAQGEPEAAAPGPTAAERSDRLLEAGDLVGAYALLEAHLGDAPDDAEARWRAVRIAVAQSVVGPRHEVRRRWANEADAHGVELLRVRPDDPEALAWAAAARGRRALNEGGVRGPAELGREVYDWTERVLARDPGHALANHVRGRLSQEIASLPGPARVLARLVVGSGMAALGRWSLAEEHHLKAVRGDPGMVFYYLDLGETYAAQGQERAAVAIWRRALQLPDRYPVDARFKDMMRTRIEEVEGR